MNEIVTMELVEGNGMGLLWGYVAYIKVDSRFKENKKIIVM